MTQLADYTVTTELHQRPEVVLYRGYRNADRAPVVIKLLKGDHPDAKALAKLRHEHALLKDLAVTGVVRSYGLEEHGGSLALILEDLGEEPLHDVLKEKRLDLQAALKIAASLAGTLDSLHRRQVIHKDIKPQNILVHKETGAVTLTEFGIATRLSREAQRAQSPDMLEGTLAYMSPEQTGRMNRVLDSRTDLYSLGVTLYEMLTGVLPFQSRDPMELVHSHIARKPVPPHEASRQIPRIVSDITMKLLSKAAEDRYQSAIGLKADLDECLAALSATGQAVPFPLGRHDRTGKLRIPQKLYGRERECLAIAGAWDRATQGAAELLLVSGYSGVGKSVLVQEVHKLIARGKGYFISGKFNQLGRSIPYAPVVHAFRELIRHVLSEPAEALARWKARLGAAAGSNGRILVNLIPELELVIGPQPELPEVGPTESQNRFALVLQGFLRASSTREQPIAIFLDDLQWADPASLKLIELFLTDPERGCLLVLGAYRDNEVDRAHPLMLTVDGLREAGATVSEILLGPLSLPDVTRFVADTVGSSEEEVQPLAELVFEKTQGNPFFLSQFLGALEQEGLLAWDARAGRWVWDAGRIGERMVTDNVIDLMATKIQRLPEGTRHILKMAACMGHQFDLGTLSIIGECPPAKAAAGLWEALREGLVLPLSPEYRFVHDAGEGDAGAPVPPPEHHAVAYRFMHDRVQQAAYSLVDAGERQELHLRIGRLLLANAHGRPADEALFDIANHLNLGASLITGEDERTAVARLNLAAGKKAKASTAYASAAGYLRAGLTMLEEASWEREYDLTLALHMERAECEYLTGAFEEAESSFGVLLAHVRSRLDRARVHQLRIVVCTAVGQFGRAIDIGRTALSPYGIDLPESEEASRAVAHAELGEVRASLAGRRIDDLLHAPRMTDPEKQLTSDLLAKLVSPAFFTGPSFYSFIIAKQVNLSLQYGHAESSPSAYGSYSVILYAWLGLYKESYEFGKLAMDLCERFNAAEQRCQVLFMFAHIVAFYRPLRSSLATLEQAIHAGLESGDLPYVSYSAWLHLDHRLGLGDDLEALDEEADRYLALMQRTRNPVTAAVLRISKQMIANLRGRTRDRSTLSDDTFDAESFKATVEQPGFDLVAGWFYTAQMELLALHGDHEGALAMALLAEEKCENAKGFHTETDRRFFTCLIYCALYPTRPPAEQERYLAELTRHQGKLAAWAEAYPESFLHKKLLVDAERARIEGDEIRALNLYGEAIDLARRNDLFHHEALGNELAARFHLGRGRRRIAAMYMADAHQGYVGWGAVAKAEGLVEEHPDLLSRAAGASPPARAEGTSTADQVAAVLDVATMSRAAQTIACEIVLEKVLDQLMRIVIGNAGAQRGVLLLSRDGRLTIDATITVDPDEVTVGPPVPAEASADIALSVVHYVERTREPVVLGDAGRTSRFAGDPYMAARPPKSLLCLAMMHRGKLTGILYLENNAATDVFTPARIELCSILSSQAAIAVENAWLVARTQATADELRRTNEALEDRIGRRTEQLRDANERLRDANDKLTLELAERERAETERGRLQEEILQAQAARVSEMSTPLIPITDRIMAMPLIGTMDASRAQQMLATAMDGAQKSRAAVVIVDITGVRGVDTHVAGTLMRTASALRLLGAQMVLTGIRPEVAQTLVELNVDLGGIVTKANLQSGIAYALRHSGVGIG